MGNIADLKDFPSDITTMVNTPALLTWLRFGTTDPPIADSATLQQLRKKGQLKTPRRDQLSVVKSFLSHEDPSYPDKE